MKSMDIYLAGKIDSGEVSIDEFAAELEDRGHRIGEKWWQQGRLPKPYMEFPTTSAPAATAMIDAAYRSNVFVLFPEDTILGAAVELGAAIASTRQDPDKQVIIVNPFDVRQSVFYAHPAVIAVEGIARVRAMDWF